MDLVKDEVVFASNNTGKLKRMQRLLDSVNVPVLLRTPMQVGITDYEVVEDGRTLRENAEKKARALASRTSLPVIADDTGFFIQGAEIDPVTVKRNALGGVDERTLDIDEIGQRMLKYYQQLASSYGGSVDAEWRNGIYFFTPDRRGFYVEAIRPSILTNEVHGKMDPHLPLRPLYKSKATGKYVLEQSEAEELIELKPITDALVTLLRNWKGF